MNPWYLALAAVPGLAGVSCGAPTGPRASAGEAATASMFTGPIHPQASSGLCLDVVGQGTANGTAVQVWSCSGSANQQWTYDGTNLRVYGNMCLDVAGGGTANGTPLQIWQCSAGDTNQVWARSGSSFVWSGQNKCLDLTNMVAASGTRVQSWACSAGDESQEWNEGASGGGGTSTGIWITTGDQTSLLARQAGSLAFGTTANANPYVDVDPTKTFQVVDGFGFALTGGSASVIAGLSAAGRAALLQELYGNGPNDVGVSFVRVSIGASDMSATEFTYDDVAPGQTDTSLSKFSIAPEEEALIPVLQAILAIQPAIKILATPWTAPAWMKSAAGFVGGSLESQYFGVYAQYFVRYITAMEARGIPIYAITPQNEPENGANDPSMTMLDTDEATFVGQYLGPAFKAAGLATKIVVYDHNCDDTGYPVAVLRNATAYPFIDGSAFHLYAGTISGLTTVHDAYPEKNVYFTEEYTASTGSFAGDLKWHVENVIIGSMQNWGRTALEWALATDTSFGPHTPGGCTTCRGAVTLGSSVTRNVGYYIVAQASKFIPPGSVRISSAPTGSLNTAAFRTPAGQTVLVVENGGSATTAFDVRVGGEWAQASLVAGAVGTYVW